MVLFEIQKVFRERRKDNITSENATFNIRRTLQQYGQEQLETNLMQMFRKEAGEGLMNGQQNFQYNPVDYLNDIHQGRITPEIRD